MKFLKGLFLVIIVFITILVLNVLQTQFLLKNTVLSSEYFERKYEANDMDKALEDLIETQIGQMSKSLVESEGGQAEAQLNVEEYIDVEWLSEQAEELAMGAYGYFSGSKSKLPTLDIEPLKEGLLDMSAKQMMQYGNVGESLNQLDSIIEEYNSEAADPESGEIDMSAIEKIAGNYGEMGLSTEILVAIISADKALDENVTDEQRREFIAKAVLEDQMGLDQMADELDLDEIFNEIYPEGENPPEAVRAIILAFKNTLFVGLALILLLLVLVIIFTAFRPASVFGWLSAPLIAGGLFGVGIWLMGIIFPALMSGFTETLPIENTAALQSTMAFVESYLQGIYTFALVQGAILLVAGIVFAVVAGILAGRAKKRAQTPAEARRGNAWLMAMRVIVVLVLLGATVFAAAKYYLKIYDEIENSIEVFENAQSDANIGEAIVDAIGLPIGDFMGGDE